MESFKSKKKKPFSKKRKCVRMHKVNFNLDLLEIIDLCLQILDYSIKPQRTQKPKRKHKNKNFFKKSA